MSRDDFDFFKIIRFKQLLYHLTIPIPQADGTCYSINVTLKSMIQKGTSPMKRQLIAIPLFAIALVSCGGANEKFGQPGNDTLEAWGPHDEPIRLDLSYDRQFSNLPTEAVLSKAPWPDTYWPSYQGGISDRWMDLESEAFTYQLLSLSELKSLSKEQLSVLSPAEKFDILRGDYSYPLVRSERLRTSPEDEGWEGLCHGWAPASVLYDEPAPIEMTNADGITIPFGSADIKAMLTYYQGQIARAPTQFLGLRCNVKIEDYESARANADDCKGVNAGAFHIVIANQIGLMNQSFIIDVTRDFQVWNHPIYGFKSEFQTKEGISPTAAPGTVQEILVETSMWYVVESDAIWNAVNALDYTTMRTYRYTLELDASGTIIGGEWLQVDRPDFMWKQEKVPFSGDFTMLEDLYNMSTGQ